jgi:hypothetical protein
MWLLLFRRLRPGFVMPHRFDYLSSPRVMYALEESSPPAVRLIFLYSKPPCQSLPLPFNRTSRPFRGQVLRHRGGHRDAPIVPRLESAIWFAGWAHNGQQHLWLLQIGGDYIAQGSSYCDRRRHGQGGVQMIVAAERSLGRSGAEAHGRMACQCRRPSGLVFHELLFLLTGI